MSGKKKLTIGQIKEYLTPFNYELLEVNYINQNQKLPMVCDKNHPCYISIKCLKQGIRCKICSNVNRNLKQRMPFEEVKYTIVSNGYTLESNETNYKNQNSILNVICPKGHRKDISLAGLKCAKFNCRECTNKRLSEEKRTDGNIVVEDFIDKGFLPQFDADFYINAKQRLPYICPNHLDEGVKYTNYSDLSNEKFICKSCYLENNSNENHWNWKGGISSLTEFLRVRLKDWKFESLKAYNFKCAITGIHSNELEIHHLYNFSDIVKETLELLNLSIKKISAYSKEELRDIETIFHEIHDKNGLGIPMTKEIHTLFHMNYGFNNNTKEQFEEFKANYTYI